MDLILKSKFNITSESDPYLNYYNFNHVITVEKNINETNEMIKNILENMNYTYSSKKIESYYTYQITKLNIYRSNISLNIHKLSNYCSVIGFDIIVSNNRIPSYNLMYSIIKKIQPDTIIPRIIQKSNETYYKVDEIPSVSDIYIKMVRSLFINEIEIGIKGIASICCHNKICFKLIPYLPYINDIINICDKFKNPKSIYECDIFTISSNICARILFQTYKKGTLNIVEYKEIINKLRLFINNINYKDKEQELIFNESLDLLNKIKKKNN